MATARMGLALATALSLAACAAPPAPPPDDLADKALLDDFHRAVYGSERPAPGGHLAKWEIPIRAALVGAGQADHRAAAERHLADLAALTGLDVAEAPRESANLLIFFAADPAEAARRHRGLYAHRIADARRFDALLAGMEPDSTCFGFLWGGWPSGQGIDFAVVFIRTDRGERTVQGCLVQETTQALGLLHDLDPDADSIFSDSGRQVELTERDRLLLRLLYDPRLKPGMGWAGAESLARTALQDLRKAPPQ